MLNLSNKYKETTPEKTIENIKNFFQKRKCVIIEKRNVDNDNGTYSCYLELYFNNHFILKSEGKGVSKILSSASGYAELYERFCGYQVTNSNPINFAYLQKYNNNDKKPLAFEEIINEPHSNLFLKYFLPSLNKNYFNDYKDIYSIKDTYGIKYKNISQDKKEKYFAPFLLHFLGSAGLAAGNTEEEALVQGCSEIFEKHLTREFFSIKQDCYYYINKETLPQYLKDILIAIEKDGYETYIYDLSYNFKMPVCMVLIVNKKTHSFYRNFGAFPIIEIAIERCLTELYQPSKDLKTYDNENCPSSIQTSELLTDFMRLNNDNKHLIPEDLILNSKEKNLHDSDIYINNINATNKELLNQIKKICELTGIDLYYNNISLCKEIQAVHIIPGKVLYMDPKINWNIFKDETPKYIKMFTILNNFFILFKKIITNEITKEETQKELIKIINTIHKTDRQFLYNYLFDIYDIMPINIFNPFSCLISENKQNWNIFIDKICFLFNYEGQNNYTDFYFENEPLYLYFQYFKENKYSHNEILKILSFLGYENLDIMPRDFTPEYYINKILFDFLQKEYNSQEYKDFINLFIKKQEDFE